MKLPGIVSAIVRTVGSVVGLGGVAGPLADAIDGMPPEKRAELEAALAAHELEIRKVESEEMKIFVSEALAGYGSGDKWVSRARPTMLYAATGVTTLLALVVGVVIFRGGHVDLGAIGAITSLLTPLWGAGAYYMKLRSDDKKNGNGHG